LFGAELGNRPVQQIDLVEKVDGIYSQPLVNFFFFRQLNCLFQVAASQGCFSMLVQIISKNKHLLHGKNLLVPFAKLFFGLKVLFLSKLEAEMKKNRAKEKCEIKINTSTYNCAFNLSIVTKDFGFFSLR
jgi:hypothetical protein